MLYSSAFISFCAFALTIETYLLSRLPVCIPMAVFIFLSTLFTYNLSSLQSIIRRPAQQVNKLSSSWSQRHKKEMAALGFISIALAAFIYFRYNLHINIWFLLHLAVISIGYTVPIVYKAKKVRPLRSVPLLKVFLIAYVWAIVTTLFPMLDADVLMWDSQVILLFARRFLFILALALLFDIRDYAYDRTTNTLTFPGLIGVKYTKLLSLCLLVIYVALAVTTETQDTQLALVTSGIGAALVVAFSKEDMPRFYFSLFADGAMLFHAALIYLARA